MRKRPRIPSLIISATQLQFFIKFSRIGFPGIQVKILKSRDSASVTESETVLGLEEIQEKMYSVIFINILFIYEIMGSFCDQIMVIFHD